MAQTLLKVDNINVFYGNIHAVKDVSFEVNEGEIVTLIGANGAGKSTTLKTISGAEAPAKRLGLRGLLKTVGTACVVTWFNPQAIIDGTLMLGAFAATLSAQQATPFITGVETASVMWFLGVTLVVNALAHKFNPKIIGVLNRVCGGIIVLYGIKLLVDFAMAVL